MVDSENGMPAAPAAVAPAISPSVCIMRVKPVGAMPNGMRDWPPSTSRLVSTFGHVAQDRRVELDVLERLARARQRELALGRAVGVVERRLRRAPLGDRAQIVDASARSSSRRFVALSSGFLNCISGRSSRGFGNWRFTMWVTFLRGGVRWDVVRWVSA